MNYIQPPIAQSHPQANNMMAAGPSGPTSTLVNPTSQSTEVQRKQFIQKQLVLLLHAHKCQQREKQTVNGDTTTRSSACTLPHCSTMKNVLQHMTRCTDHKACPVPHCVTSRQIILHWKQCTNVLCPICQPLKTPASLAQNNPTAANAVLGTVTSASLPPNTNQISKEWQRRVTEEMRNHLVQKIITALIPSTDAGITRDKRILNLTHYAQRVEMETFNIASNQEEYFHKLAEKIYKIQKELEDRREKKRLQDLQMATQSSTSMNDYSGKRPATMDSMAGGQGPPNRTAPQMDYSAFGMGHSQQTLTNVKAEPFVTLTNSGRALMPPNNGHGTFTVTNVPANENLDYLLNGGETIQSSQGHDVDMLDTSRTSQETHSFKNEPMSPRHAYQVCSSPSTLVCERLLFLSSSLRLLPRKKK